MLQQFFVIFILFTICTIIYIAQRKIKKIKLILPIYRFLEKEISINKMYEDLFKKLLENS